MENVLKYLLITSYSLLLIPIWGLTMINNSENTNEFSAFLGYVFTVYSLYLVKESKTYKSTRYALFFILIGPTLYLVVGFTAQPWQALIFNYITFGFILTIVVLLIKNLNLKILGVLLFVCYFFPYHLSGLKPVPYLSTVDKRTINKRNLNEDISLSDFKFVNQNGDTVNIPTGKPILIETWNETCKPCIASMIDLEDYIDRYEQMEHIYLYEALGKKRLSIKKVFNYKRIENKSKILVDVEDKFRTNLDMQSYPYFLMFDKDGNLVDYFAGYAPPFKEYFEGRIEEMYQKTQEK